MARHIQVILKEEVDNLGSAGEVVRVRPGYARNFLLPRNLASLATRGRVREVEHERKIALKRAEASKKEAEGLGAALSATRVKVEKNVGEEGKLYGSVTAAEIADALKALGYDVDRRKIQMPNEVIKAVGEYSITVKLVAGVSATFTLEVTGAAAE